MFSTVHSGAPRGHRVPSGLRGVHSGLRGFIRAHLVVFLFRVGSLPSA